MKHRARKRKEVSRPAIRTIAEALQLSVSTVSRALNGVYGVHSDTRRRVLEKAEEIGYVPNLGAKQLVGKGSGLVGIIMPELGPEASAGFGHMLPALLLALQRIGKDAIFFSVPLRNAPPKRLAWMINSRGLEACVMLHAIAGEHPLMQEALALGVPCVNFEGVVGARCSSIVADDYAGGMMAAQRLLADGHRVIGHIRGPARLRVTRERCDGFLAALEQCGIKQPGELIAEGDFTASSGARAIAELLACRPDMTAVFCANDLMAAGAIQALTGRNIAVPARISICGYDGDNYSACLVPPLTTINYSPDLFAEGAAVMLTELLAGREGRVERVAPKLLERQSITRVFKRDAPLRSKGEVPH